MTSLAHDYTAVGRADDKRNGRNGVQQSHSHHKRSDIQGLRMVAVAAVVLNHLVDKPRGGFVGVDVFFVISGFLISGRLLRMLGTRSPATYLLDFYKLRIRRILPAALVAIALVILASRSVYSAALADQISVDGGWAAVFWANWHFVDLGTNYFSASGPTSPLQHYWSLAVEEQFYLVWPIILLLVGGAVAVIGRRDERAARTRLLVGAIAAASLCVASFWWALRQSADDPTTAYFSSLTRGWELGLGALLACLAPWLRKLPAVIGSIASWLGLAVIGVSLFAVHSGPEFPAPLALLPVAGSALVLAGGIPAAPRNWVLTNRVSVFIGDVSYSIYLFHFPVIILLSAKMPDRGGSYYVAAIALTLGLAVLSWALVEEPIRNSRFLLASDERRRRPISQPSGRIRGTAVLAATLATFGLVVFTLRPYPPPPDIAFARFVPDGSSTSDPAEAPPDPDLAQPSTQLAEAIAVALQAPSFPTLKPSVNKLGTAGAQRNVWKGCQTTDTIPASCRFGERTPGRRKRALVVGDSISMSWLPGITRALAPSGWSVAGFTRGQCPVADVRMSAELLGAATASGCDEYHRALPEVVAQEKPSLIIMSSSDATLSELASKKTGDAAVAEYESGLRTMLSALKSDSARLVFLSPPPKGASLQRCDSPGSEPVDCVTRVPAPWTIFSEANARVLKDLNLKYVNTKYWFCAPNDYCPAFVGTTPTTYEGTHTTREYSEALAGELAASLRSP
jgi:peptidoglycan/LPS O-acetylase OafA/YrhL